MNDWIEHPWEREDREIREALEKKDAEIERLKFLNKEERETIDELSSLCSRAAAALEVEQRLLMEPRIKEVIDELRKAAE